MKKLLLLTLILVCSISLQAQNRLGFKAGTTTANFRGIDDDGSIEGDLGPILGIQLGVLYEIKINPKFSILPEFLFYQKGFKASGTSEDGGVAFKFKNKFVVNYLELPVLGKYAFGDLEEVHFFLTAGPSFGYANGAFNVVRIAALGQADRQRQPANLDDLAFQRFEVSLALGAGIDIPMDVGLLFFETRFLYGLTNLNKEGGQDTANQNIGLGTQWFYCVLQAPGETAL